MATRDEIESVHNVEGLCTVARSLGYKDPCYQLQISRDACVGDLLCFFEDNPGAVSAVAEWMLENCEVEEDEDDCAELEEEHEEFV